MLAAVSATLLCLSARAATIDLSTLTANYTAHDGDVLTGETTYAVTIADGATVTLAGVTIKTEWSPIVCAGDATVVLADDTENAVTSETGSDNYSSPASAGIFVGPDGTTLTIRGGAKDTGRLTATGGWWGAGIGTSFRPNNYSVRRGSIVIAGGIIVANGGRQSPGIGVPQTSTERGTVSTCTSVTITGGTITATGGWYGDGIGGRYGCTVAIAPTITKIVATSGFQGQPIYADEGRLTISSALTDTTSGSTRTLEPPVIESYADYAAAYLDGAAMEATDASGIANVFRYVFDVPTGDFEEPLIDIAFEGGAVVVKTPKV